MSEGEKIVVGYRLFGKGIFDGGRWYLTHSSMSQNPKKARLFSTYEAAAEAAKKYTITNKVVRVVRHAKVAAQASVKRWVECEYRLAEGYVCKGNLYSTYWNANHSWPTDLQQATVFKIQFEAELIANHWRDRVVGVRKVTVDMPRTLPGGGIGVPPATAAEYTRAAPAKAATFTAENFASLLDDEDKP